MSAKERAISVCREWADHGDYHTVKKKLGKLFKCQIDFEEN
jgi:hypothetical protein